MPAFDLGIKDSPNYESFIKDNEIARKRIAAMPPLEKGLLDNLNGNGGRSGNSGQEDKPGPTKAPPPGDPNGPPNIKNVHVERQLLWTMNFNTHDGVDYAKQLQDMGAKVAVPLKGEKTTYLLIKDLAKPKKTESVEDLSNLNLIWWTDDKARSVEELAKTLEIKPVPSIIIAFFPRDLEDRLAEMELAYAKKNDHKSVDEIAETTFQVKRSKNKYEPVVVDQKYKK